MIVNKKSREELIKSAEPWFPECHNNPEKLLCDHCMDCWALDCNRAYCDRRGRCMCEGTDCICLGRLPQWDRK